MQSLGELVRIKLPLLAQHLTNISADIATDAFLCCYCTTLPSDTAMRVWDSLFLEGPKILYRVQIYLLKVHILTSSPSHPVQFNTLCYLFS